MRTRAPFGHKEAERELALAMLHVAIGQFGKLVRRNQLSLLGREKGDTVVLTLWFRGRRTAAFRISAKTLKLEPAGVRAGDVHRCWPFLRQMARNRTIVVDPPQLTHPAPRMLQ
jgi:hypothetical protein